MGGQPSFTADQGYDHVRVQRKPRPVKYTADKRTAGKRTADCGTDCECDHCRVDHDRMPLKFRDTSALKPGQAYIEPNGDLVNVIYMRRHDFVATKRKVFTSVREAMAWCESHGFQIVAH